jgi:hypothetical protein
MTHDDKRNGTTTLFAALNVLDDTIIGRSMNARAYIQFDHCIHSKAAKVALAGQFALRLGGTSSLHCGGPCSRPRDRGRDIPRPIVLSYSGRRAAD